jgi:EmrB/QacA subfamily drug resistance transporter
MAGLVGFVFSSLLCSLAPSIFLLIILRAIQGFTAAMMISVSLGIVKKSFPISMLGEALGIYAVLIAGGLTLGPAIGGILDGLLGWRSIFLINLPMGILSLIICFKILDRGESKEIKWDIIGTISQFLALFSLVYLLNYITSNPINMEALILSFFTISMVILFVWWERRTEDPILNLSLFRNISFSAYNLSLHLNYVCMYMIIFVMPFYLLKVLHLSTNTTGLVLTAAPLLMMFLAPISGIISDKFGSRPLSFIGALICAVAFYSMTELQFYSNGIDVFLRLALLGVGAAIFQSPTNRAIMSKIPNGQAGVASGILVTMRNLGMVFAVCYAGILLSTTINPTTLQLNSLIPLQAYDLTTGMHLVVTLGVILSLIMALLSVIGILTGKVIKKEVLDRIHQD